MALMTSPLTKSKPCLFLPFTHAKKLGSPPAILLNYGHYNPKFLPLTTNKCKKEKLSSLLDASNKNYSSTKKALQVVADAGNAPLSEAEPRNLGKIFLSDVVVRRRRQVFWGRKWNSSDIVNAGVISAVHFLSLFGPFYFTWPAFWVALGIGIVTGLLGITLSFHRNLSHRSFKLPKWLEYFFAYCGVQALQRDPIFWVSTHRHHHQFCDSERDPHSPTEGFWFSHITWLFDNNYITEKGVRTALALHITWLINSASHLWGKRAWNTGDLSRNNWWLALLTFGEGWHNNHHAFEYSARHGLEWWQIDMTWYVVRFLQAIGLATDVKLPSEVQKQRMAFNN
ncbi:palmitoyl-monogalactosyldiacylglycerol delta-7 desaturase, chloroplastic-like isoform X2 [Populus trichocarpa]|uniref:palmitoyl-monogalactosyldiacylglycerol delta-7 desaturase, chloroplastic-like isoform X2 n=1 Tax=Populus trichocarpa TaxID=3694 RepID=UPI002278CEE1|nr:palmitoyl-monogalactosyldiacylglycerol delta-7 desaturase, chloroplastic-like isoform X2 [Populus trichocarpa]